MFNSKLISNVKLSMKLVHSNLTSNHPLLIIVHVLEDVTCAILFNLISKSLSSFPHTLMRCCGKLNNVGTASARSRVVWPVRSKCFSSKWSEHNVECSFGVQWSLLMFTVHLWPRAGSLFGNLWFLTGKKVHAYHNYLDWGLLQVDSTCLF